MLPSSFFDPWLSVGDRSPVKSIKYGVLMFWSFKK